MNPIIVGAIGTAIAAYFQNRSATISRKADKLARQTAAADQYFGQLDELFGRLVFESGQVFTSLYGKVVIGWPPVLEDADIPDSFVMSTWEAYQDTVKTWNIALIRNKAFVASVCPNDRSNKFEIASSKFNAMEKEFLLDFSARGLGSPDPRNATSLPKGRAEEVFETVLAAQGELQVIQRDLASDYLTGLYGNQSPL